jgi:hypothetical protein
MFGFPINLQNSGVQKFTFDADNGFPKIQQREIFYSVKDGDWNDQTIWETASGRVGKLPTQQDDVYIRNVVTYTSNAFGNNIYISNTLNGIGGGVILSVNNLYSSPNSIFSVLSTTLRINQNVYCSGIVSVQTGSVSYNGTNSDNSNFITQFIPGTSGGFFYTAEIDQNFINGITTYNNLSISGGRYKNLTSNTIVNGSITLNGSNGFPVFDCLSYDLQVGGTFIQNFGPTFSKSGPGNLLFIGQYQNYGVANNFTGNPNVEFRGGGILSNINTTFYTGTGTWSFTTNNQDLTLNFTIETFDANILIGPGITLTMNTSAGGGGVSGGVRLNQTINGTNGSSRLILGGGAFSGTQLYFNTLASISSMTTGTFDYLTNTNTIGFTGNYTTTIPTSYSTFRSLAIAGTGIKSLGINTTLNENLIVSDTSNLELLNFNFVVNGTTRVGGSGFASGLLSKNGSGSILFVGSVDCQVNGAGQRGIDFSGNPNVEFRNGLIIYSFFGWNTGTGTWTFSTNNQTINGLGFTGTFNCTLLISGAINLTFSSGNYLINNINGNNALSKLINAATLRINNNTGIMSVGQVDFTTNVNTIAYVVSGNYTIPNYSYRSLTINGGGTKTLASDTTLLGNLTIQDNSILECSNFNLSVNGNTTIGASGGNVGTLSKNNATGGLLFIGSFFLDNNSGIGIDFSGNPNVEFRGGISNFFTITNANTGTGTWSFTTNNQTLTLSNPQTFNCAILVANNIILTISHTSNVLYNNIINGGNAASTLRLSANTLLTYRNATQPMATGILDTSTNLNTWIYGNANQDIKGGPTTGAKQVYRNLTLNGGGTKTLQGFVSVLNTYTLTSPATLNNNGFTLTNP